MVLGWVWVLLVRWALRTGCSNGERTLDSAEFLVGDEGRVSGIPDVDLARLQEAADILRND